MKNTFGMFGIVVFFFLLQTTVLPPLMGFLGHSLGISFFEQIRIDLVFFVLLYLSMHRGFWGTLVWAASIGEMFEIFGGAWKGASTFSSFAVALLGLFVSQNIVLASHQALIGLSTVIYFIAGLCHLFMGGVFARIPDPLEGKLWLLFFQSVLNGFLTPWVFWGLGFLDQRWRRKWIGKKQVLLRESSDGHSYL